MRSSIIVSTALAAGLLAAPALGADDRSDGAAQAPDQIQDNRVGEVDRQDLTLRDERISREIHDPARLQQQAQDQGQSAQAEQSATSTQDVTQDPQAVREIQQSLQDEGHEIAVDGVWGPNTEQALSRYQQERGLGDATGQPDQETLQALGVEAAGGQPQTAQTPADQPPDDSPDTGVSSPEEAADMGFRVRE